MNAVEAEQRRFQKLAVALQETLESVYNMNAKERDQLIQGAKRNF